MFFVSVSTCVLSTTKSAANCNWKKKKDGEKKKKKEKKKQASKVAVAL
jgi:hypothetical protein